jgi:hypothetical protein
MKATIDLHLNWKNGFTVVASFCIVGLTVIPLFVPADQLAMVRWKAAVVCLMVLALVSLLAQSLIQSREDHLREAKDQERDKRQDSLDSQMAQLVTQLKSGAPKPTTESLALEAPTTKAEEAHIDGEIYRLVMSPRSIAWPLVRDMFRIQGRPDEAVVDTDILVEMYLVNQDADKTRYVREIWLSAEVNGHRVEFKRQDDLQAEDFNDKEFEYGLKDTQVPDVQPIHQLANKFPLALSPGQPVEGWVRFTAKEINADKIAQGTVTVTVVDSLGKEYPINKVTANRERRGEIGLRRVGS